MKKTYNILLKIFVMLIVFTLVIVTLTCCNKTTNVRNNDEAEKDKEGRNLTIINETGEIINQVSVTVGDGTEIESMKVTDEAVLDKKSFSLKIPEQYEAHSEFVVTLVDRFELIYQKKVSNVLPTGRTEVKLTEDDYVKREGDWWRKITKLLNRG